MEREVGGGIGMGNTCKPMAVSFQCITKFTTSKKNNNNNIKSVSYPLIPKCKGLFHEVSMRRGTRAGSNCIS